MLLRNAVFLPWEVQELMVNKLSLWLAGVAWLLQTGDSHSSQQLQSGERGAFRASVPQTRCGHVWSASVTLTHLLSCSLSSSHVSANMDQTSQTGLMDLNK